LSEREEEEKRRNQTQTNKKKKMKKKKKKKTWQPPKSSLCYSRSGSQSLTLGRLAWENQAEEVDR
jgi:hypothetical protein